MYYLPIKVKMATPRASSPRIIAGMARPNADKPYNRKNRIKHHVAIELGILIFILLCENGCSTPRACYGCKHSVIVGVAHRQPLRGRW